MEVTVPSLSVVIPVYRAASLLPELIGKLEPVLKSLTSRYELVLVDDHSPDDSWRTVEALAEAHSWIRGLRLMRNYGQHSALLCGIREAKHGIIVTMDDDLQHPPEEIPKLLAELERGYDVVYGAPQAEKHSFMRNVASRVTKFALQRAMGAETARHVSAFRAFRRDLRDAFARHQSQFVSIDVLLTWGTTRFGAIRVRHDARAEGVSNYTVGKLITHGLNMLTGFSVFPLQLASITGFLFTLFGIGILGLVLVRYMMEGTEVPGFPFLASVIAIFSGAQLFALGIIGEYLARMHFRMIDRPTYVVGQRTKED